MTATMTEPKRKTGKKKAQKAKSDDTDSLPDELEHYDDAIEAVRGKYVGVRIRIGKAPQTAKWAADATQAALAAVDGADEDAVSLSSRLLDPKIESVGAVNDVLARVNALKMDRRFTLPFTRPGVRLVKTGGEDLDNLKRLTDRLTQLKQELAAAAEAMYEDMPAIRRTMEHKLKRLYDPSNYDFDPRLRYTLQWNFEDVDVPSYLQHNAELHRQAEREIQQQMRESIFAAEQQMAEGLYFLVDHLAERLESRRLLDRKYEVLEVEKAGDTRVVTYRRPQSDKKEMEEMSAAEFERRVTDDERRKSWKNNTATRLFDEIEYAEEQIKETGIGKGQIEDAFGKLKSLLKGHSPKSLVSDLKENGDYREAFRNRLETLGNQMLDMTVVQGRRKIIRKRSRSKKLGLNKT